MDILIILATLVITLGAQGYINSMYKKTKKINTVKGVRGADVARTILDKNGLTDVKVRETSGVLSDHYDPRNKTVNLSPEVFGSSSVASLSVAAHECGHAIQDKDGYFFLKFRNSIVPFVNLSSKLGYVAIIIGIFSASLGFLWFGIAMELIILFFQLITLPVEFNASERALENLINLKLVTNEEKMYSKKMLFAAALTYVASVATAILEVLRLVLIARNND